MGAPKLQLASDDRYLSQDPIGFAGGDANLYRYVWNNPLRYRDPSGLAVFNPTNVPNVPNSCGNTPIQTFYEPLEATPVSVIIGGGNGPTIPYSPDIYGLTWGNTNSSTSVNIDINTSMNPSDQTLNNTLIHEGTHALGGGEGPAYGNGNFLYPPSSSP
jgi:uncharacterized protein RhaS with RHS repeats